MKSKIRKLGNSLGIILPKDVLDLFGLKENDEIEINTKNKQIELILKKNTGKSAQFCYFSVNTKTLFYSKSNHNNARYRQNIQKF